VGCFPLLLGGGEGESGTPIWLLGVGGGVPVDTPSVGNEPSGGGIGGGSSSGTARISGMYFFHPDHLGSITMITDGNGNVLAGGERGGKSHITYKPYGEILRTDSYGPDIAKFKYTGQEEDRESGLYYYKARYYDASLGRFASNDGMTFPKQAQGMNRMMYVEGNPVRYNDPSGNNSRIHMINRIIGHAVGKKFRDKGGSFSTQKIFSGIKGYRFYEKAFGKFDKWYGRSIGRDRYVNTANYHVNVALEIYSMSKECTDKHGKASCQQLFLINRTLAGKSERKYEGNTNPFGGIFDLKIKPDSESSDRVENDSAKVICLNYFSGRPINDTPSDQDFIAGVSCSFVSSSSNSLPSTSGQNDGFN
jgi:RHS repeat-associated protein